VSFLSLSLLSLMFAAVDDARPHESSAHAGKALGQGRLLPFPLSPAAPCACCRFSCTSPPATSPCTHVIPLGVSTVLARAHPQRRERRAAAQEGGPAHPSPALGRLGGAQPRRRQRRQVRHLCIFVGAWYFYST
jgi:hypothetical protein